MSASDRNALYTETFQTGEYANGAALTGYQQWGALPDTISPIIYYTTDPLVGEIYTVNALNLASAVHASSYPQNQYMGIQLDGVLCGNPPAGAEHCGSGVVLRYSGAVGSASFYKVMVNGTTNMIYVHKVDQPNGINTVVDTYSHPITQFDTFYVEVESTGNNGCDVRVYHDDTLLTTYVDSAEVTGVQMGVVQYTYDAAQAPGIVTAQFGNLDSVALRGIDSVNPDGIVKSLGSITVNGTGLTDVTGASISTAGGARPYTMTITDYNAEFIVLAPVDIMDPAWTLPHGELLMTLAHPEGDLTKLFTMASEEGWQSVTLSSPNSAYMAKDLGAVTGDILEVPISVDTSSLTLLADSDVIYDGAVAQGTRHDRRLFGQLSNKWDSGVVTINQESAAIDPTPPTYDDMECFYGVYFEYDFSVGWTDADPAGYSAINLPNGLSINSAGLCTGTPTAP